MALPFSPFSPDAPDDRYQYGGGSGFVYDRQGHIITNNHVIADAERIEVAFADDTTVEATVVGRDPDSDLAVIRVNLDQLPDGFELIPLPLGDSDALEVGETVVAIGSPFGFPGTLTVGIISGLGRSLPSTEGTNGSTYTIPEVIQTDAAINPGNSGGPLLDARGQVIGVNAAIESPVRGSSGVGFAIPVSLVKQIAPILIEEGEYEYPWIGIYGNTLSPRVAEAMNLSRHQRGALVVDVVPGGPAEEAGIQPSEETVEMDGYPIPIGGDVITAIDGEPITSFDDLIIHLVRRTEPGETVEVRVLRDGEPETLSVTLAARPQNS
jgi:2-alkenal reductase